MYFVINRLIGYIEQIEGSSDKYLVVATSVRNKNIISVLDMVWRSIKNKINPNFIKIEDYDKFRFNFDIYLPLYTLIEFRSLVINVSSVIDKDINKNYVKIKFGSSDNVPLNILVNTHTLVLVVRYQRVYMNTCWYEKVYEKVQVYDTIY